VSNTSLDSGAVDLLDLRIALWLCRCRLAGILESESRNNRRQWSSQNAGASPPPVAQPTVEGQSIFNSAELTPVFVCRSHDRTSAPLPMDRRAILKASIYLTAAYLFSELCVNHLQRTARQPIQLGVNSYRFAGHRIRQIKTL